MMNGKKYLYTLIFIIFSILLINIIWPSAFLSKFKKEVFQNFKDNSEAYIKIKDYIVQKADENHLEKLKIDKSGYVVEYIDGMAQDTREYAHEHIKEELKKLTTVSKYFDFVIIRKYKGEYIVSFVFDSESATDYYHDLIYCKDKKILNEYCQSINKKVYIKTIENQWYYVDVNPDISHK